MKRSSLALALVFTTLTVAAVAGPIPTQTQVMKNGALKYFTRLPKNAMKNLLELMNMGTFALLEHEYDLHVAQPNVKKNPFRIFGSTASRRKVDPASMYPFVNSAGSFKDTLKVEFGLCAGFSTTIRKFQMLAFFDPTNIEKQDVPNRQTRPKEWLKFMQKKIDSVMDRRMTVIPGFANLNEFASDPEIAAYIKEQIVLHWEMTNVSILQGVVQGLAGVRHKMTPQEMERLHETLSKRLKMGFNPIVYLHQYNDSLTSRDQWIHVLQVVDISPRKNDGSFEATLWDINYKTPETATKKLVFNPNARDEDDDKILYDDMLALGNVIPLRWDDLEIADMVEKNLDFCLKRPGFCTENAKPIPNRKGR